MLMLENEIHSSNILLCPTSSLVCCAQVFPTKVNVERELRFFGFGLFGLGFFNLLSQILGLFKMPSDSFFLTFDILDKYKLFKTDGQFYIELLCFEKFSYKIET